MASVTYTAVDRGELVGGHTAGLNYGITFDAVEISPSRQNEKQSAVALDGTTVTTFYRQEKRYSVVTEAMTRGGSAYNNFMEFLTSVVAGESFDFDAYGTIASPDNVEECILEGDFQESRLTLSYYRFSFTVRVIA